jgi:hypothetical protein
MNIILRQYTPAIGWLGGYDRLDKTNLVDLPRKIYLSTHEAFTDPKYA